MSYLAVQHIDDYESSLPNYGEWCIVEVLQVTPRVINVVERFDTEEYAYIALAMRTLKP